MNLKENPQLKLTRFPNQKSLLAAKLVDKILTKDRAKSEGIVYCVLPLPPNNSSKSLSWNSTANKAPLCLEVFASTEPH